MTALCPAWAYTYQSLCHSCNPDQPRPGNFRLPKPKMFSPTCRVSTRLTGIEFTSWRLFTDGSFKRNPDGTDAAGWGIAAVPPENTVQSLYSPVICGPRHPASLGAATCSNHTAELTGLAEAIWWANFLSLVVKLCVFLKRLHARCTCCPWCRHARRNINLANRRDDLLLRIKDKFFCFDSPRLWAPWQRRKRMRRYCGFLWPQWAHFPVKYTSFFACQTLPRPTNGWRFSLSLPHCWSFAQCTLSLAVGVILCLLQWSVSLFTLKFTLCVFAHRVFKPFLLNLLLMGLMSNFTSTQLVFFSPLRVSPFAVRVLFGSHLWRLLS